MNNLEKDDIKDIDCQRLIINTLIDTIIIDEENDRGIVAYRYNDDNNGTREFSIKTHSMCSNVFLMVGMKRLELPRFRTSS